MASLNEKIADSLDHLRTAGGEGETILRRSDLSRTHVERLLKHGYLRPLVSGWVMVVNPSDQVGDSTPFFANFWRFLHRYCEDRFGPKWVADAATSLRLLTGERSAPSQVMVASPSANNLNQELPFQTSLFARQSRNLPPAEMLDGMRLMPFGEALSEAPPAFFKRERTTALAALAALPSASDVLAPLLRDGRSTVAGRLAAAFRAVGRVDVADEIVGAMRAAGHNVTERDNPLDDVPVGLAFNRRTSPVAARITAMWAEMRGDVIESFPEEPSEVEDKEAYMAQVDGRYVSDSYHSLSIEGYHVTPALIEKVRNNEWKPDASPEDRQQRDALAAKGYAECFEAVREAVADIVGGTEAAPLVRTAHMRWFRDMFQPAIAAGIFKPEQFAGYRRHFIYLKGSRYVPVAHASVQDAMDAYFDALEREPDPRARAVLGHFIFTYIHPLPDGNGRIGRFIMNAMLASGGYPWTVVPVDERARYMAGLDSASLSYDIKSFATFVADLVRREPPPPRRRSGDEAPVYREEPAEALRR